MGEPTMREVIPLRERKVDWILLFFYTLNLTFITYVVDIEQLMIADPHAFEYPVWPPAPLVDLVHWWGDTYDPLQNARPPWWRATIWIDVLLFGPFYAAAIYAHIKGKDWIRMPSVVWAAVMWTNVTIIVFEEMIGPHATPEPAMVLFANAPWWCLPYLVLWRMWSNPHPLTREVRG
jgi:hypothetical protein